MIVDVFTYNGEADILEIRLNILSDLVDQFILVEFDKTFSGKPKEPYFSIDDPRWEKWKDKITHQVFHEAHYEKYRELAESSPNTQGADHWKREFMQKESIKDALTHLNDDDIVFIGDVDEIWDPGHAWSILVTEPLKIRLLVYTYYLNNYSSELFSGTLAARYKHIKSECLNHLRSNSYKPALEMGWHFTSMGGYESVKKKLSDSYTKESYWTDAVAASLKANIIQGKDFLGRDFTYTLDESDWPPYLKENKSKYKHLCR